MQTIQLDIPEDLYAFLQFSKLPKETFVLDAIREKIVRDKAYQEKIIQHPVVLEVKKKVLEAAPDAEVILYGSRARGDFRRESDWDFMILLNTNANTEIKNQIQDALFEISLAKAVEIDHIIYTKKEWKIKSFSDLYHFIQLEGIQV